MNINKSNHIVADSAFPRRSRRLLNTVFRLFTPLFVSTVGRLYMASKFSWLGFGVRVDSLRKVKLGKSVFLDKGVILEAWHG